VSGEPGTRFRIEPERVGEVSEALVDEPALEGLVAVAEQADEVVGAWPQQRILEVDPNQIEATRSLAHHQVRALVVAMHEAARKRRDAPREALRKRVEALTLVGREQPQPRL